MSFRGSHLRLVILCMLVGWACVAAAQEARSRPKRKPQTTGAKAPVVAMLSPILTPEQATARARAGVEVVMYSAGWCEICDQARAYFVQHGVAFAEHDVERDARARARHKALSP